MKILHVCKMTGVAGAETHLLGLLEGLRTAGLDVEIMVLTAPGIPLDAFFAQAAARHIPTHQMTIRAHLDPGLFRPLRAFFRAGGYDIVHTHLIHADLHGILAARYAGGPHIVSSRHNDDHFRTKWPVRRLNRWLWQKVDHGIAISEWVRRFSIAVEGAPPERISTVYYGLDPAALAPRLGASAGDDLRPAQFRAMLCLDSDTPLVGTVCRLAPQKGVAHALRAFSQVANRHPAAHFIVAGDGPLRAELMRLTESLGLGARVHFLGWRDDPHNVIAALDVLMGPSYWEGFGLVLLEAMALGVPVIASRVSAIPEVVVDGETGILAAPGDEDTLSSALSLLLGDPDLAQAMGAAGRARLEARFTAERMVAGVRAVYEALG